MKTQQETVFRCEFCNKPMFSKGHMTLHERMCRKNPNNQHKCFQYCEWLCRDTSEDGFTFFYCANENCELYDKYLYSYKLDRNYLGKQRIKGENLVRMPLKCEHYEIEDGHDEDFLHDNYIEREKPDLISETDFW